MTTPAADLLATPKPDGRWVNRGDPWFVNGLKQIEITHDLDGRAWISEDGRPPFEVTAGTRIVISFGAK